MFGNVLFCLRFTTHVSVSRQTISRSGYVYDEVKNRKEPRMQAFVHVHLLPAANVLSRWECQDYLGVIDPDAAIVMNPDDQLSDDDLSANSLHVLDCIFLPPASHVHMLQVTTRLQGTLSRWSFDVTVAVLSFHFRYVCAYVEMCNVVRTTL